MYYDGSEGGSFYAADGVLEGNFASGSGGGLAAEKMELIVSTIGTTPDWGAMSGVQTNGSHLIFLSASFVFATMRVSLGQGRGEVRMLSGVFGVSGYRDGLQSSATPPLYMGADISRYVPGT